MAVLNHFGSFLELVISNSNGGYAGLLQGELELSDDPPGKRVIDIQTE